MKIALFSDTYPPNLNGVATATETLRNVLISKGHEVIVVTSAINKQRHTTFENGIVRIPGMTLKHIYNYHLARIYSFKTRKIINEFKPDIIHVQTEYTVCILGRFLARKYGIPLVYTYHTLYEDYSYYITGGLKPFDSMMKKVIKFLTQVVSDNTTELTTTSFKARDILAKYDIKKYINEIPNGIDFSMFDKKLIDQNRLEQLRKKYNLEGKYVLIILGRIAQEKSNDIVISSLNSFLEEHPQLREKFRLLVVGDGPARKDLENLSSKLNMNDIITFTKAVPHEDVPYYYYLSNLYVSASTSETQGLTFNEAMACDVIVLARHDKNLEECIIDNKTGFFYTDLNSFKKQLLRIYEMDEEKLKSIRKAAYENNVTKYSLDLYYRRMMNVYNKAVKKYW